MTAVRFWLDPECPWAYAVFKWLEEVKQKREISISWHLFSIGALNQPDRHAEMPDSAAAARVMAAAMAQHGDDILYPLYQAIARRLHDEKQRDYDAVLTDSLAVLHLPETLIAYKDRDDYDDALRAGVAAAAEAVGQKTGIPAMTFDGRGFNGPIISPRPRGEGALKLWDALVALAQIPEFYQIQRKWDRPADPA